MLVQVQLQAEFAVRTEPDEFQAVRVGQPIEEQEVRPEVTVAMIFPVT